MSDDIKTPTCGKEEAEKLYSFLDGTVSLLNNNMNLILYKAQERQQNMEKYNKVKAIEEKISGEDKLVKQAIVLLKGWYNKSKDTEINNLQDKINNVLSEFFGNKYNLKLTQGVERGNNVVNLVAQGSDGKPISTMDIMLSGAEQQMSGFLIQAATTTVNDESLMILDEAFSSFGVKEVARIPELLAATDKQILLIEHKDELFENFPVLTYTLDRSETNGTYIKEVINKEGEGDNIKQ